ncbi:uncharacterized protein METZ01_LOCUS325603, partial [marine metagenome]
KTNLFIPKAYNKQSRNHKLLIVVDGWFLRQLSYLSLPFFNSLNCAVEVYSHLDNCHKK